jgi:Tfp pilus assembly ATPase PilU
VLRGIVNQRLLERADGKGRTPAVEVMVNTPRVAEHILVPDATGGGLERTIADGEYHGMQTLDQSLMALARDGHVSMGEALAVANDPTELRISMQTAGVGSY